MAILVNENGTIVELTNVYANESGTVKEHDTVYANENGALKVIHEKKIYPTSLTWTADSKATIHSTANDGLTVEATTGGYVAVTTNGQANSNSTEELAEVYNTTGITSNAFYLSTGVTVGMTVNSYPNGYSGSGGSLFKLCKSDGTVVENNVTTESGNYYIRIVKTQVTISGQGTPSVSVSHGSLRWKGTITFS